jgi:hypothetical protein
VSYVAINPSYYQMYQPESAWHSGAEGWSVAPYPGWGQNPNLVGPKRLAVEGLGDDAMTMKLGMAALGLTAVGVCAAVYLLAK